MNDYKDVVNLPFNGFPCNWVQILDKDLSSFVEKNSKSKVYNIESQTWRIWLLIQSPKNATYSPAFFPDLRCELVDPVGE